MKLIKPKAELLIQPNGLEGIYKQIEKCGRTCYRSEDKITEDSAKPFVDRMIKSNHLAMLEHGTVYLMIHTIAPEDWDKKIGRHKLLTIDACRDDLRTNPTYNKKGEENWWAKEASHKASVVAVKYADNPYSKVRIMLTKHEVNTEGGIILTPTEGMPTITKGAGRIVSVFNTVLVTTNLRVLVENNWLDDLQYVCKPTEFHEKRYTFRCITSIGVTREMNRHRVNSIAEQSTRYCNYSKNKFGGEISFIIPEWMKDVPCIEKDGHWDANTFYRLPSQPVIESDILGNMLSSERHYMSLIECGWSPQQAREVLPLCTATEIIHTAFASDWKHFFDLRYFGTTGKPHPNMLQLTTLMKEEAEKHGIWNEISNSNK